MVDVDLVAWDDMNKKKVIGLVIGLLFCLAIVYNVLFGFGGDDKPSTTSAKAVAVPQAMKELIASKTFPVSQPAKVPEGYKRTNVEIVAASRSGSGCEEILQNFQATKDSDVQYIDVYSYAPTCSYPRPDDAEKYLVGDYEGWVSAPSKPDKSGTLESVLFELAVNQGLVRVETDLTQKDIEPVLKKFVPFDATPPRDTLQLSSSG